jgi:hypothetical protein
MKLRNFSFVLGVALCSWFTALNPVFAQGTAFTYQGSLSLNGAAASGSFDFQFILLKQSGSTNAMGSPLTNTAVAVTNGLFTTTLDFGNQFTVSPLYLEVGVRAGNTTGSFTILNPPQLITSVPYAIQSLFAANYLGAISDSQLSTNIAQLDATNSFGGSVSFNNASGNFSGTFSGATAGTFAGTGTGIFNGNGGNLTNLNVTNIVGVVQSNPNWQLVQSSPQQAVVANNYLTTNSANTTVILPASPGVGSTLRVANSGANGWTLTQNAGQSVLTTQLGLPAGQLWVSATNLPSQSWHAVAVSANGFKMAAAYNTGFIYYSNDGGQTWTQSTATSAPWVALSTSTDGSHMLAAPNGGYLWTSTNGGTNFTAQSSGLTPNTFYTCCASSANGVNLVAASSGAGSIYTSSSAGTNWTKQNVTSENWTGIASSADGTKLAACASGASAIYTSTDSGVTWTNHGPVNSWSCIASSADGTRLVAAISTGQIYTSGDAGVTWTPHASSQAWTCVTSSADGVNLAAAYHGFINTSNDSGQTWQARTNGVTASMAWNAIGSSADGSRLLAAVSTGNVFTSTSATTIGAAGSLIGNQYSNIELQYVGNGLWMPLSFLGTFTKN